MTDTMTQPTVRHRARTRQLDVGAGPTKLEIARAKAIEAVEANLAMNAAKSKYDKLVKELAAERAQGEIPDFTIEVSGVTYDCRTFADKIDEVDVALLSKEVDLPTLIKLVKSSQVAVKDHGGSALLSKVLKAIIKPAEYKIRKRKAS